MKTVLLLEADFVQTYSVCKSLRKSGYRVIVASSHYISYGFFSIYPNKKYHSPSFLKTEKYIGFLKSLLKKEKIDIIIPLTNDAAEILSKNFHELSKLGPKLATMPWENFIIAHDKGKFMTFCEYNKFPHPRTRVIKKEDIDCISKYIGYPALIKPNISVGARGIIKILNDEQLNDIVANQNINENFTLQQLIENKDFYYNVMMYRSKSGEILGSTVIKISRFFPVNGGSSAFCETLSLPDLESICSRVLEKLNWIGFADFDILFDYSEGYKIIEINPRIPASIHAASVSGINFPEIICRDLLNENPKKYDYQTGKQLRFLLLDIMWFLSSPNRFKKIKSWCKFSGKNMFYQDISYTDPLVFFAGIGDGLKKILSPKYWKEKLS